MLLIKRIVHDPTNILLFEFEYDDRMKTFTWEGVYKKDPAKRMIGVLSNSYGTPKYTEKLYMNGKLNETISSVCRATDA
jgi:hypothetical protein